MSERPQIHRAHHARRHKRAIEENSDQVMPVTMGPATINRTEQLRFGDRFRLALEKAGMPSGHQEFTDEFNSRAGNLSVKKGTIRKWLIGVAIPGQPRLKILAGILGVSPHWLKEGEEPALRVRGSEHDRSFRMDLQLLNPSQRKLVRGVVDILLKEMKHPK